MIHNSVEQIASGTSQEGSPEIETYTPVKVEQLGGLFAHLNTGPKNARLPSLLKIMHVWNIKNGQFVAIFEKRFEALDVLKFPSLYR